MFLPERLRRLFEKAEPSTALVEAEGDLPSSFDLLVDAEGLDAPFPGFESEGRIRETPSGFESSGGFRVEREGPQEWHEVSLVDDDGYFVEGSHLVPARRGGVAFLRSERALRSVIGSVLGTASNRLKDAVTVEVETHEAGRGDDGRAAVEYRARLVGLGRLSEGEDSDGNDEGGGERLRVEDATVTLSRGEELVCFWEFDLRHHGRLFAELLADRGYETAHGLRAARRSSGFSQNVAWNAGLSEADGGLSAEVSYGAEDAERYADALGRRGLKAPSETEFSFELDTHGGTTSASFESEGDGYPTVGSDGLEAWFGFLPLPVALLILHLS